MPKAKPTIGQRIKSAREARDWSQVELAERSGVPQPYISNLEAGKQKEPGITTAAKLAKALGMTLDELAA